MTVVVEKLRTELTKLNAAERGELAHFLIRSLDPLPDKDAEAAWRLELDRRHCPWQQRTRLLEQTTALIRARTLAIGFSEAKRGNRQLRLTCNALYGLREAFLLVQPSPRRTRDWFA